MPELPNRVEAPLYIRQPGNMEQGRECSNCHLLIDTNRPPASCVCRRLVCLPPPPLLPPPRPFPSPSPLRGKVFYNAVHLVNKTENRHRQACLSSIPWYVFYFMLVEFSVPRCPCPCHIPCCPTMSPPQRRLSLQADFIPLICHSARF